MPRFPSSNDLNTLSQLVMPGEGDLNHSVLGQAPTITDGSAGSAKSPAVAGAAPGPGWNTEMGTLPPVIVGA
jgi:hypothetical protein